MRQARNTAMLALALAALLPLLQGCAGAPRRAPGPAGVQPPQAPNPLEHVQALVAAGDVAGALASYQDYLATADATPENRLLLARLLLLAGRMEEARREAENALAQWPESALAAHLFLAGLEEAAGNPAAQRAALEEALLLEPRNLEALAAVARLAVEQGDAVRGEASYQQALRVDAAHPASLRGLAAIRLEQERWEEAAALLDRALAVEPADPFALVDRSRARAALGDLTGALADLDEAVALQPSYPWTYIDRGRLNLRLRRQEAAQTDFSRAIVLDPENFLAYVYRAGLADQQERLQEARGDYERALALNPGYYFAFAPLATLYYIDGNWSGAAALFRKAYEQEPEEYAYALMSALSLKQEGKAAQATEYVGGVLSGFPQESWCYETARYLMDPAREAQAVERASRERNRLDQGRMLFYIAAQLLLLERPRTALTYLATTAQLERRDLLEKRIARVLLERYGYKSE